MAELPVSIKRVAILANPTAGRGRGKTLAREIVEALREAGIEGETSFDMPAMVKGEMLERADAIVAIGGDGTLRAVAQRCLEMKEPIPPLLPVPGGTANLMGRHFGFKRRRHGIAERVVASLERGQVKRMDVAKANGSLFLLMVGVGIDAQIIHGMSKRRKGPIRLVDYFPPTATALGEYRFGPVRVSVDGREVFPLAPAMAFVANIAEYGTGFAILPDARPDDGLLDVCVVPVGSHLELFAQFLRAARGKHLMTEGVVSTRGREILIESTEQVPAQVDGEQAGHTPVQIGLLPAALPFIVPV